MKLIISDRLHNSPPAEGRFLFIIYKTQHWRWNMLRLHGNVMPHICDWLIKLWRCNYINLKGRARLMLWPTQSLVTLKYPPLSLYSPHWKMRGIRIQSSREQKCYVQRVPIHWMLADFKLISQLVKNKIVSHCSSCQRHLHSLLFSSKGSM